MKSGAMKRRTLLGLALATSLTTPPTLAQSAPPAKQRPRAAGADAFFYRDSPVALAFADDVAARRNLDVAWVRDQIGQAQRSAAAIRGVTPPPVGVPKNWAAYRARFIEPIRLAAGQRFWLANRDTLARATAMGALR